MGESVDTLKQRVVGAFVIISLAVIFLPMIFDEPRVVESNVIMPIPPRPDFKVIEIEKPQEPKFQELVADEETQQVSIKTGSVTAAPAPDEEQASTTASTIEKNTAASSSTNTADKPAVKAKPEAERSVKKTPVTKEPVAKEVKAQPSKPQVSQLPVFKNVWMVQLGTFSNTENAFGLRDQLRKDGFDGHTKQIDLDGKQAVRVFTGPFVDRREAEKIKKQVDKKYNLQSQIIFFDA